MGRLITAGALLSVALGSALTLPVAAQAATSAPTAGIARMAASAGRHGVQPGLPPAGEWQFSGFDYPGTAAGLADCNAEGRYLLATYPHTDVSMICRAGSPDPGYDLWIYFVPGGIG